MEVRKEVFVVEQNVPPEFELDNDDTRSYHWVAYATSDETTTGKRPIGTLRLIPGPHAPHPEPFAKYMGTNPDGSPIKIGTTNPGAAEEMRLPAKEGAWDRATILHDGVEPYVKLGRLAVVKEFRGKAVAGALVKAALDWLAENMSAIGQAENGEKFKGLVCVHAQTQVVKFWAKSGFEEDTLMGTWWEEGIAHNGMFCRVMDKR